MRCYTRTLLHCLGLRANTLSRRSVSNNGFQCPLPSKAELLAIHDRQLAPDRLWLDSIIADSTGEGKICGGQFNESLPHAPIKLRPYTKLDVLKNPTARPFPIFTADSPLLRVQVSGVACFFFTKAKNGTVFTDEFVVSEVQAINLYEDYPRGGGSTFRNLLDEGVLQPCKAMRNQSMTSYFFDYDFLQKNGSVGLVTVALNFTSTGAKFSFYVNNLTLPNSPYSKLFGLAVQLAVKAPVAQAGSTNFSCDPISFARLFADGVGCSSSLSSLLAKASNSFYSVSFKTQKLAISYEFPYSFVGPSGQASPILNFDPPIWTFLPHGYARLSLHLR